MTGNTLSLTSTAEENSDKKLVYDVLEYTIVNSTLLDLSGCTDKTVTSVTIPAEIDGMAVVAGASVFADCPDLLEINVDDNNTSLEDIDGVLFDKNSGILLDYPRGLSGDYVIPDGTKIIEMSAFENASALTSVTVPDSLEVTGPFAFKNCTSLTGFVNSIPLTSGDSISGCKALKSLTLAETSKQTMLTNLVFNDCKALENVTIPDSYILNGDFVLRNCPEITEIKLPETSMLTHIIIYECDKLSELILPKTFADEKNSISIANCDSITALDLTSDEFTNVTLENLDSLEKVKLNASQKIAYTISSCEKLSCITYLSTFKSDIDYDTCPNLKDIYYYENESCHITDIKRLAANDITVHCKKSNTRLQEFLTKNNVSFVFIDDETLYGDSNCDGEVTLADAVLIMQFCCNPTKYKMSDEQIFISDVYNRGDGITLKDALSIQNYTLGLIDCLLE